MKKRIFITMPMYAGDMHEATRQSLLALARQEDKYDIHLVMVGGDGMLDRVRAFMFSRLLLALAEGEQWDYYLQLDADLQFHPDVIARLIEHDKDVIGALYPFKSPTGDKAGRPVYKDMGQPTDPETGLREVYGLAGGFIFVKVPALLKMCADRPYELCHVNPDYFDDPLPPKPTYHFWQCIAVPQQRWGEGYKEYLSEDYALCHRLRQSGFQVWADMNAYLRHWQGNTYYECQSSVDEPDRFDVQRRVARAPFKKELP